MTIKKSQLIHSIDQMFEIEMDALKRTIDQLKVPDSEPNTISDTNQIIAHSYIKGVMRAHEMISIVLKQIPD